MSTLYYGSGEFVPFQEGKRPVFNRPEDPGLADVVRSAVNSEWAIPWTWRMLKSEILHPGGSYDYDPSEDQQFWSALTDGVDESYLWKFAEARSPEHALAISDNLRSVTRSRQTLAQAGVAGVAASLGAAILDPVSIAAGFGVGGIVGKAGRAAGTAAGTRSFIAGGLAGMASEVPIETFLTTQDPDRGATDILLAGIGSFGLGGLGEFVSHKNLYKAMRRDAEVTVRSHAMGAAASGEVRQAGVADLAAGGTRPTETAIVPPDYLTNQVRSLYLKDGIDPGEVTLSVDGDQLVVSGNKLAGDFSPSATLQADLNKAWSNAKLDMGDEEFLKPAARKVLKDHGHSDEIINEMVDERWGETRDLFTGAKNPTDKMDGFGFDPWRASGAAAAYSQVRRSFSGFFGDRRLPESVRKVLHPLVTDPLRRVDGSASIQGADAAQDAIHRSKMLEFKRYMTEPLNEYIGNKAIPGESRTPREFFHAVMQEVEQPGGLNNKSVKAAAERWKTWTNGWLDTMKREGLISEEDFLAYKELGYVPHRLMPQNFRAFVHNSFGGDIKAGKHAARSVLSQSMARAAGVSDGEFASARDIYNALGTGIKRDLANIDNARARAKAVADKLTDAGLEQDQVIRASDAAAQTLTDTGNSWDALDEVLAPYADHWRTSRFYLETALGMGSLSDSEIFRAMNGKQLENLRRILRDQQYDIENLTDDNITEIVGRVMTEGDKFGAGISDVEKGKPGNLRSRTPLDLWTPVEYEMPDGTVASFEPNAFFDTNLASLAHRYSRAMSAAVPMRRFYQFAGEAMGRDEPIMTRQGFMAALEGHMISQGVDPTTNKLGKQVYSRVDAALREIHGMPPNLSHASSEAREWLRAMRRLTSTVRNGSFTFAQIPEMARLVAYSGVRNMINSVPAMRDMYRLAKAGKIQNDLWEYGDFLSGIFGAHEWNDAWAAFDPEDLRDFSQRIWIGRRDADLQKLERVSFHLSGFAHVDRFARRLSMASTLNKFINDFTRNRPWNAAKLRNLGLDEAMADRIRTMLKHELDRGVALKREPGFMGQKVAKFRVSDFEDQEAMARLVEAIGIQTNRTIQDSTLGSKLMAQQDPYLQIGFQFYSFAIQGWEKHTLWGLQQITTGGEKAGVYSSLLASTLLGSVVYAGQTYLNAVGRDDKDEYLDDRLGGDNKGYRLFMAGLQRGGNLTFLPQLVDIAAVMAGQDAPFDARSSGLTWGGQIPIVQANPTSAYLTDVVRAASGLGTAALGGDDYSRQDLRAVSRLVPLQNHLGFRQMWNAIANRLPEEERN